MFRKIHNSDQNAANAVKLYESESGCCSDGNLAQCQYDVTIPTANAVNSITYKNEAGANVTKTFSPAVTGATAVKAAIKSAVEAAGYEDDTDIVLGVSSKVVSTNTIYSITGELVIVNMVHNTSTTVNATVKCVRIANCVYAITGFAGGAANDLKINGVSNALGAITPGTTLASAVKTAVEGALTAQSVTGTVTVTTTGSGGSQTYNITIADVISTTTFELNGVQLVRSTCLATYKA